MPDISERSLEDAIEAGAAEPRTHRQTDELIKRGESKTLEFESTLRWGLKEDRQDDKIVPCRERPSAS